MEKSKIRVTFAGRGAALVVGVDMIAAKMTSDIAWYKALYVLVIDGFYLLKNRDCTNQNEHNELEVSAVWIQHSLHWVLGLGQVCTPVCPARHTYMCYPTAEKMKLSELLFLEEVAILVFFSVVEHGYMQHGNAIM